MNEPLDIQGILIDIDGVLVVSWGPLPGTIEALRRIKDSSLPYRLLTNTTTSSRETLAARLRALGYPVEGRDIITAPVATAAYLRRNYPGRRCFLIAKGDVGDDLGGIDLVDRDGDVVVVAGAEENFSYETLNQAFRMLRRGAALVAMHRNSWWMTAQGPRLDAGAFIAGLELASGVQAEVVSKPSPAFFEAALASLGTTPQRTAMVGDDLISDTRAAQEMGMIGVQVRTGKFRAEDMDSLDWRPDHVLTSFAELPALLVRGSPGKSTSPAG